MEQNPGPTTTTFLQFVGPLGDVFTAACDQTVLARQLTDLHFRLKSLGVALADLTQILLVFDSTPAAVARLVAAFELYAGMLFSVDGTAPHWLAVVPPPSPTQVEPDLAVTSLLQRIFLLETLLSATPAVKPPFLPLSEEAVVAFSAVPGRPKWMVAFTSIFTDYVADMSDDGPRCAFESSGLR